MKKSAFIVLVAILISLSACGGGAKQSSDTPTEISPTPTELIPTPTPKPTVACPQEEVDVYIKEYGYIMEEWDDTYKIAQSTSRINLGSAIGNLQSIKREISRLVAPECAFYISDITGVAMESSIDALLSFLGKDSDSIVQRKLTGAIKTWEIVDSEFQNFKNSPIDAYMAFNLTTREIEESVNQPVDFVLPENWVDSKLSNTDLVISHPREWDVEYYGEDNLYIKLKNEDGTLGIYGGYFEGSTGYTSDRGQLFALQTYLETEDYDYYNERSANVEVFSQNRVYMVEYSVRQNSGDDIESKILSYIFTPGEEQFIFYCDTTRDEFAQIDLLQIQQVFGSIRK